MFLSFCPLLLTQKQKQKGDSPAREWGGVETGGRGQSSVPGHEEGDHFGWGGESSFWGPVGWGMGKLEGGGDGGSPS